MKIGYPCINHSIGKKTISTFRLSSFTAERFNDSVTYNLNTLYEILRYNKKNNLLFFRISSDLIPFASHPIIAAVDWKNYFKDSFKKIGKFIKKNDFRISMHPDQFVLLNSKSLKIVYNSIAELNYHNDILDLMDLDNSAKIQIHVGGVYEDKGESIKRFVSNFKDLLPDNVKRRIVIENDDHCYNLNDCMNISNYLNIPIIFDIFHHKCLPTDLSLNKAMIKSSQTWDSKTDGILMVDYSSQDPNQRKGKHANTIDINDFRTFLKNSSGLDFDIMLEIKDKEISAKKAVKVADAEATATTTITTTKN